MRKIARKIGVTIGLGAVAVAMSLVAASPAQAASAGDSCKLSANWTVKFSANYTQATDNSSYVNYVVLNSPGTIAKWQVDILSDGGSIKWESRKAHPANPARMDPPHTLFSFPQILILAWAPSGAACDVVLPAYTV